MDILIWIERVLAIVGAFVIFYCIMVLILRLILYNTPNHRL